MGEVYQVVHRGLGRAYALKLLASALIWDEAAVLRFEREVQALALLDHPSVVQIHHSGRTPDGRPFCVMDLVEGGQTLADATARGVPPERFLGWVEEIAEGLGHAHSQGLVHRDVKPQNILIDAQQRARLSDFGLVKSLAPTVESLTQSGVNVGTPRYMAPEQVQSELPIGPHTDVFALGAVVFEFFCGKTPFEGGSALETYQILVTAQSAPTLQSGDAEVDRRYGPLLLRTLSPRPEERPPDGAAFAAELRQLRAAAAAPPQRSLVPLALAIAALALAIFALLGVYLLLRREVPSPSAPPSPSASLAASPAPSPKETSEPSAAPVVKPAWIWEVGQARSYELKVETEFTREMPRPSDPVASIRTGAEAGEALLAGGSEDPGWTVSALGAKPQPARVPARMAWPRRPLERAQWICPPKGEKALPQGRYRYRTAFEFPKTHSTEGAYLAGVLFPDDHLRQVLLNGEVVLEPETPGFQPFAIELPITPQVGENVLEFVVENTGKGAAGANPTGLGVELALLADHSTQTISRERYTGTRAYDLDFKAISVSTERVTLEVSLRGYRLRRELSEGEAEPQVVLFDSGRETGAEDPLQAAVGAQFRLEIDPRSGEVTELFGSRRLQDAIDAALDQTHGPDAHCVSHSIPEFASPERLKGLLSALWNLAPPAGKAQATTWAGAELPSTWLPLDFPAATYPIRYALDKGAVIWNGQGKVSRARGSFENAGELRCEGRGRMSGGAVSEAGHTVSLEGKLAGDLEGQSFSFPFRCRARTTLTARE
jgi:serine/threonine protein kinase